METRCPYYSPEIWRFSNPNKWRGIALPPTCSKAVSLIAATPDTPKRLWSRRTGWFKRQAKGCADATFTLKTALQNSSRAWSRIMASFVDLVKAYDTVNREMLWKNPLKILGVPDVT
jgi:hypothetical protein